MPITTPKASFSRPANTTQYADGDLVANNATAGSVTPMEWSLGPLGDAGIIRRVRIHKTSNTTTAATFSLHLFASEPTVANGDNGAFSVATNLSTWLGKVAVDMSSGAEAGGSADCSQVSAATAILVQLSNTSGRVYGLLEAGGTYTPTSAETFTVTLEIEGGA